MQLALHLGTARTLALEDAPALQALLGRCAGYFRTADGRAPAKSAALERIADSLGDEHLRLWGLWLPGRAELSGLLELRLHEPSAEEATVVLLLVDPASRRRGLGRDAVESLCRALGDEGFSALHLGVQAHEHGARAFWESLGFAAQSEERGITNFVRLLARP